VSEGQGLPPVSGWPVKLIDFLHRRARWLIGGLLIATVAIGYFATRIQVDNSLEVWFIEGDPALVAYDRYKKTFGNDEIVIVAATAPEGIYAPKALERVRAASKRLEEHPKVRRVTSLAVGLHAEGSEGFIEIEKLLPDSEPITEEMAAEVKRRVASDPIFQGTIVGNSDKITLILVEPKTLADWDRERHGLIQDIDGIARKELVKDGGGLHLGGIGVVYEGLNQASLRDSGVFVTLSYLILLGGLWVVFRRIVWVLVGAGIVSVAVLCTLGIAGLFGRDMNMVTAIIPTLIMTVGILDLIHLIDAYQEGHEADPKMAPKQLLRTAVALCIVPCIVNSFTDVIGFASFIGADMAAIRDLGWLVSAGLMILLVSVIVIGVPALAKFGARKAVIGADRPARAPAVAVAGHGSDDGFTLKIVRWFLEIATRHRIAVLVTTAALTVAAVVGMSRLVVDTYTIGFLPEKHPVRIDHNFIEKEFGRYIPLEFTAETKADGGVKQPEFLTKLDATERSFEKNPSVSKVTGLPEIIKRVNQLWADEDPKAYTIPQNEKQVAEQLLTYGFSADGRDNLDGLMNGETARITHVTARSGLPSANEIQKVIGDLEARGKAAMGDTAEIKPAGYLPLYVRITQNLTDAQISSAGSAFLLVTIVLMLLLRSVKLGLLAMVPNLVPAMVTLGFMGFTGIRLDLATVLIAGIIIGISVNDTSHLMFRFKHELGLTPDDPEGALRRMMNATGRAVVASSLIMIAGFSVLVFASVKSVVMFGLLTTVTVTTALIADLIVTPAIVLTLGHRRRRKAAGH
jgi:uncharacterized protein